MESSLRNQLNRIDSAVVQLLQERAKLLSTVAKDDPERQASIEGLLRQTQGRFDPKVLSEILEALGRGCN